MRRSGPTPAIIVAILALTLCLGGVSYAAGKIGTKDLKNGAVTTAKIKNNAVNGSKVKNNSLTGVDINEAKLVSATGPGGAISLAGLEFQPRNSADTYTSAGYGDITPTAGSGWFSAPLHLPDRAVVMNIAYFLRDNTGAGAWSVSFARYEISTGALKDVKFQAGATVDQATIQELDNTPTLNSDAVIDNTRYAYYLLARPSTNDPNLTLHGAELTYSNLPSDRNAALATAAPRPLARSRD